MGDTDEDNVEGQCAVCDRPARQRCSACHEVFYCGREHQKLDWSKNGHKNKCRKRDTPPSYMVCDDPTNLGRHLIATRDIGAGELVLREAPLIEGPSQFTFPVCVVCYQLLTAKTARPCDKCGWPVCSRAECWRSLGCLPHVSECDSTCRASRRVNIVVFEQQHPSYQSIAPIRCLHLKDSNPEAWSKLINLQSHCKERKQTPRYNADRTAVGSFILNFMKFAERGVTEQEVLQICGILQVNGHEVPTSDPPHMAVYEMTSLLEHSCIANCTRRFLMNKKGVSMVEVRTLRPIKSGEHLSICYSDPLWCTASRRMQLQQTKFFNCTCPRCCDPRELGSMMSGVRCLATPRCLGFQFPVSPLDQKSTWKCDVCQVETSLQQIEELLIRVGKDLSSLTPGDCDVTENFVTRVSGSLLHPNHQYVTDARLALIQMWGRRCGDAVGLGAEPDHVVASKLKACEQLKTLVDIVAPGATALRGLILMELQSAKAEESRRRLLCGDLDPPGLRASLMESRRLLVEAVEILRLEAASTQDREQAERATHSLFQLDNFLQSLPKS